MIENSMFEEEPDVVDLAKEPCLHPLEPDEVEYEPRSSRLLVRGLGEHELDEDEEDYESSAKLLGMSFMNRSTGLRNNNAGYRQTSDGSCSAPSVRTTVICVIVLVIALSVVMAIYLLPKCTFTKEGCHKKNHTMELIYPLATNGKVFPWANIRLPNTVMPIHYDIVLHPNLTTMIFSGSVQITVKVLQSSQYIILHSSKLNITKATLASPGSSQPKSVDLLEYPINDQIAISASEALLTGQVYIISMEFFSNLSNSYSGLYRIGYKDDHSEKRWLAATQFEPLAARSAFPCFDEPAFKATFQVKVNREKQYSALSNMPKNATKILADGIVQDEFSVSLKMSTYLVAVVVGNLTYISKETNKTLVSVYTVPQKSGQAEYALDTAVKLLEFYQKYFGILYPLKKLDLVAIPDFQAGAMENWGLITFRETTLLYDNKTSSAMDKKRVTTVIAHELAHQWFGNLVTMEWWNDLWLNEGFATFMEYFAMKTIFPDLCTDDNFLDDRFKTMVKDSMNSSHPISLAVQSPEEIEEMFDAVSYGKGASLLLMLKKYLHKDIFQAGIQTYLHNHSLESTRSDDLWDSMNKATNGTVDVKNLMKTWTTQKGFPLVTIKKNGTQIQLKQEKYGKNMELENQTMHSSYLWHIPLSYITSNSSSFSTSEYMLDKKSAVFNLPGEVEWVKFNVDSNGYYIVQYSDEDWTALIKLLKGNPFALSSSDRANLIQNIFSLAGLGQVSIAKAFDLIEYIMKENSTAPIVQALYQMSHIYNLVDKRRLQYLASRILSKIRDLLGDKIEQQKWTSEGTILEQELKSNLLTFACSHNLPNVTTCNTAAELFEKWKNSSGTTSLPTDVMNIIFRVGAKTESGWNFLLAVYHDLASEPEKLKILEALASSDDVRKLIWLLKTSLEGDIIRSQDFLHVITTVSQNLPGHLLAWDFVKENWNQLIQKFHRGSYTIQNIVITTTSQFSTQEHLQEVKAFFESKSEEMAQLRCVQEAIERIQLNIQWMALNLANLKQLL
ncbi:leucyl-cystinyl aminopeptidase isoform X2 [Hemicordylus capensis]|nr:leucyl-cystinyl aminopeptidase isoform X2 [Hemicordylus capensis]XP_053152088.1 leucyl-cystinyl aminopeptidase isoform X2 [Hemicordylus capensis]XP_053152089.1 leucyl-cystinyl aminopeptidase isoform X2 [Hemicordylus capensis]XP_053152090.1 leucyl-cystinyl aminopeptidase isoform X2 [Hemicordylus capensis]XP_053152091.1 leucyl-cystinyl aminopeptidase isoform X2 [Hemicordylus capensis]XP_053152092.1 leucyl-cystinyl aminopeptidase isoform X2 [Hemicordylus capensis]